MSFRNDFTVDSGADSDAETVVLADESGVLADVESSADEGLVEDVSQLRLSDICKKRAVLVDTDKEDEPVVQPEKRRRGDIYFFPTSSGVPSAPKLVGLAPEPSNEDLPPFTLGDDVIDLRDGEKDIVPAFSLV